MHFHADLLPRNSHLKCRLDAAEFRRHFRFFGGDHDRLKMNTEGGHKGIVKLPPLYLQLIAQAIFCIRRKITLLYFCDKRVGLLCAFSQFRSYCCRFPGCKCLRCTADAAVDRGKPLYQPFWRICTIQLRNSSKRGVDTVEETFFLIFRFDMRSKAVIRCVHRACQRYLRTAVLRLLKAETFPRDLHISLAQDWVISAGGYLYRRRYRARFPFSCDVVGDADRSPCVIGIIVGAFRRGEKEWRASIHLERSPRAQSLLQLLREHFRIASSLENFLSHQHRGRMVEI